MLKWFDKAFVVIVFVVLVGPLALVGAQQLEIRVPSWASSEDAAYLSGYTKPPVVDVASDLGGFITGEFQEKIEKIIDNEIPCKAFAMLANAKLERCFIAFANVPFRYRAYPTYYSSNTSVIPEDGLIVPTVPRTKQNNTDAADELVQLVIKEAEKYPDTRFVFIEMDDSEYNPTYDLVSETYDEEWANVHIISPLANTRVIAYYDPIASYEEYKTMWFSTERHWNLERALQTYNWIADQLDLKHVEYENPILIADEWYGSRCRLGLCFDYSSEFYDMPIDFSYIEWLDASGRAVTNRIREQVLSGSFSYIGHPQPVYAVYDNYYGAITTEAINTRADNDRTCLVVSASYAKAMKNFIADNYSRTVFVGPNNDAVERSFDEYLSEGFDDVIILLENKSYSGITSKSPHFLELPD